MLKEIMANQTNKQPTIFITGDDEYLITQQAAAVQTAFKKNCPDGELEIIDGRVSTVSEAEKAILQCRSALASPGLFSANRLVWLRNADFLADSRPAQSATVQEALTRLLADIKAGLPDGFQLLITAEAADKRRAFYKGIRTIATIKECKKSGKSAEARQDIIRSILEKTGCSMSTDCLASLAERTGSDTRRLVMEVEKVCLYVAPRTEITVDDLDAIVSASQETAFYELANRFGERDLDGAIRCLHELLFQKHSVMGLMAHLENTIRDILVFREALDQGWLVRNGRQLSWRNVPAGASEALSALDKDPRKLPPFIAGRVGSYAQRFTRKRLDHCLHHIVLAHEKMVSTSVPPEIILENLLVRMLGTVRKQKGPTAPKRTRSA